MCYSSSCAASTALHTLKKNTLETHKSLTLAEKSCAHQQVNLWNQLSTRPLIEAQRGSFKTYRTFSCRLQQQQQHTERLWSHYIAHQRGSSRWRWCAGPECTWHWERSGHSSPSAGSGTTPPAPAWRRWAAAAPRCPGRHPLTGAPSLAPGWSWCMGSAPPSSKRLVEGGGEGFFWIVWSMAKITTFD